MKIIINNKKTLNKIYVFYILIPLQFFNFHIANAKVPYLGTSYIVSQSEEYNLGQAWVRQFKAKKLAIYDVLVQDYLEKLVNSLIIYAPDLKNRQTQILLVNDKSFNAFAVPGGIIGVNYGIFKYLENEGELAAILAHEIGHLSQRHFVRRVEDNIKSLPKQIFGLISSVLVGGITSNPQLAQAGIIATRAQSIQHALYYSRFQEQEADRIGLQILKFAGYPAKVMAMAFGAMQHQVILNGGNPPQFLITHPLTETRIADIQARIDAFSQTPVYFKNKLVSNYPLIRIRAAMLENPNLGLNSKDLDLKNQQHIAFATALYAVHKKNFATAQKILKALQKANKHNLVINYSLAELYYLWGKNSKANKELQNILELNSNYYPALYLLAKNYNKNNYEQAKQALKKLSKLRANDEQIWFELYNLTKQNKDYTTYMAKAEYLQLLGDFKQSLEQLKYAEQNSKYLDFPTQARMLQRIEDIQKMQKDFSFD